jgi:hypothetical protein
MAKRYKLREVERLEGDLHEVIPKLVNQGGQAFAAIVLKVSQATISTWLKSNGYRKIERWEKAS